MNNWLKYFNEAEISGFRVAENLYGKAYLICEKVFEGKKNKAGLPYMDYLVSVADLFNDDKAKAVSLMHDIFKETDLTESDLSYIGFPSDVVNAISILTRDKDEEYDNFINRIINSKNRLALKVKKADLKQSMDVSGFDVSKDYLNRIDVRYKPQYEKIKVYLSESEES